MSQPTFDAGMRAAGNIASAAKNNAAMRLNQEINDSMVRMRTGATIEEQTQVRKKMFESGVASLTSDERSKIGIVLTDAQTIQVINHDREQFAQSRSKQFYDNSLDAEFRAASAKQAIDSHNFNYTNTAFESQQAAKNFCQEMRSRGYYSIDATQQNGQWVVQTATSINIPKKYDDGTAGYEEAALLSSQNSDGSYSFTAVVDGYEYTTGKDAQPTQAQIKYNDNADFLKAVADYNADEKNKDYLASDYKAPDYMDDYALYEEQRRQRAREADAAFGYMSGQFGGSVGELGWALRSGKEMAGYAAPFIRDTNAEHLLVTDNPFTKKASVIETNAGDKLIYVGGKYQGRVSKSGETFADGLDKERVLNSSQMSKIFEQDVMRRKSAEITNADILAHEERLKYINANASSMGQKDADYSLKKASKSINSFEADRKAKAEIDAFKFHTVKGHKPTNGISVGVYDAQFRRRQFMARQLAHSQANERIKRESADIINGAIQTYNLDTLKEVTLVAGGYGSMLEEQLKMQHDAIKYGGKGDSDLNWFLNKKMLGKNGEFDINGFRNELFDAATRAGVEIGGLTGFSLARINKLSEEEISRIAKQIGMSSNDLRRHLRGFAGEGVGLTDTGKGAAHSMLGIAQQAIGDEDLNEMVKHGSNVARYGKQGYNIGKDFATSVSYQREALLKRKAAQGSEIYKKKLQQFEANKAKWAQRNTNFSSNKIGKAIEGKKARFAQTIERNKFLRGVNKYNPFALAEKAKRKAAQEATKRLMNTKIGQALAKLAAKAAAKLGLASTGIGAIVAVAWEVLDHLKEILAALAVKFAVSVAGMIMPVLCCFVLLAFVVLNIAGLFEDDDPESYTKTAAYQLNEQMQNEENVWLKALQDGLKDDGWFTETTFENKEELTWGWDNEEWEDYIKHFKNLEYKDKKLYINPFWKVEGLASLGDDEHEECNKDALTPVEEFDGKKTAQIFTNPSIYSELEVKSDDSETEAAPAGETSEETEESYKDDTVERYFCEDGNTSNARDVLSMVDIMYSHEPEDNEDSTLESIFDAPPSYYTKQWFKGLVTNILGTIYSWLTGDEYKPVPIVSYQTIQNYTMHTFMFAHAQVYTVDVSYYSKEIPKIKLEGEEKTLKEAFEEADGLFDSFSGWEDFTDSDAAKLGFCKNPKEIKFEIDVIEEYSELPNPDTEGDIENGTVKTDITPVIKDNDGNPYGLAKEGRFDVTVTVDDIKEGEEPCLWNGMGSNEETYKKIRKNDCWSGGSRTGAPSVLVGGPDEINSKIQEINNKISENVGQTFCLKDKNTFEVNSIQNIESIGMGPSGPIYVMIYFEETWTRSCHKHTFVYSAGQLDLDAIGLVNTMWNEHQVIGAGQYPDDYCNPTYLKNELEDNGLREPDTDHLEDIGFEDVMGKVDLSEADTSSISQYVASTKGKSPNEDAQGSYVGSEKGINFYLDGDDWGKSPDGIASTGPVSTRWLNTDEEKELQEKRLMMRDIFDIDMFVPKGYNIFPYNKDEWSSYEAWSDDNILLASTRLTGDWYEYFNFDIPSNIGERTLAEEDIDKIIENIKATGYLTEGDDKRETVVKTALYWVGRGHYNAYHTTDNTDHEFLTKKCTVMKQKPEGAAEGEEGIGWDMISTASDSKGFAHWLYHIANQSDKVNSDSGNPYSNFSGLKAGDIIVHKAYETDEKGVLDLTIFDLKKDDIKKFDADAVGSYTHDVYSIVIGQTNEKIRTKGNIEIPANSQLIVQMDTNGMYGTVRLRWSASDGYFDHFVGEKEKGIFVDTFEKGDCQVKNNYKNGTYDSDTYEIKSGTFDTEKDYNRVHYYWVENPDDQTKVIKFGS